jgi:hypothetical protein
MAASDFIINLPEQGPPGTPGTAGTPGAPGNTGSRGPAVAIAWNYAANVGSDPLPGEIMLVTPGPTAIRVERHERGGTIVSTWLSMLGSSTAAIKGYLHLIQISDETKWMIVSITAAPTEYNVGKWSIPVALVAGSPFTFDVGQQIAVGFVRSGDNGINGAGGDMFGANNLSELANKATAFNAIKQAASLSVTGVVPLLRNYLSGFQLSNDVGDLNNDISITPGQATDANNVGTFGINSTMTKQLDVPWSPGDHAGGLDAGSKANSTWYFVYAINRPDIDSTDFCFSTNNIIPTFVTNIPAEYTYYRRIGQVLTNGSGNIIAFSQYGDRFWWDKQILAFNASTFAARALISLAVGVPSLVIPPIAILGINLNSPSGESNAVLLTEPSQTDNAPTTTNFTVYVANTTSGVYYGSVEAQVRVDTTANVAERASIGGRDLNIGIKGYIDLRGKSG